MILLSADEIAIEYTFKYILLINYKHNDWFTRHLTAPQSKPSLTTRKPKSTPSLISSSSSFSTSTKLSILILFMISPPDSINSKNLKASTMSWLKKLKPLSMPCLIKNSKLSKKISREQSIITYLST